MDQKKRIKIFVSLAFTFLVILFLLGIKQDFVLESPESLPPHENQNRQQKLSPAESPTPSLHGFRIPSSEPASQKENVLASQEKTTRHISSSPLASPQNLDTIMNQLGSPEFQIYNSTEGLFKRMELSLHFGVIGLGQAIQQLQSQVIPRLRLQKKSRYQYSHSDESSALLTHHYDGIPVKESAIEILYNMKNKTIHGILNLSKKVDPQWTPQINISLTEARAIVRKQLSHQKEKITEAAGPFIVRDRLSEKNSVIWEFKIVSSSSSKTLEVDAQSGKLKSSL